MASQGKQDVFPRGIVLTIAGFLEGRAMGLSFLLIIPLIEGRTAASSSFGSRLHSEWLHI